MENIHPSQRKYISDALSQAKMRYAKSVTRPMSSGQKLTAYGSDPVTNIRPYRSIIGALQYATITMPEIKYSVNKVCHFIQTPEESHLGGC